MNAYMTLVWAGLLFGAACAKPPSSTVTTLTADQVTAELVEAGCLAPGSSSAIVREMQVGHDEQLKAGLACMFDGGTVEFCTVPCARSAP